MNKIELPIPFVLGRMAFVNRYPLDNNPFEFPLDSPKCLLESIDYFAKTPLTYDRAIKIVSYIAVQPKFYQWTMGYRYEKIRLEIARKADDMTNKKFYNNQSKLKGA